MHLKVSSFNQNLSNKVFPYSAFQFWLWWKSVYNIILLEGRNYIKSIQTCSTFLWHRVLGTMWEGWRTKRRKLWWAISEKNDVAFYLGPVTPLFPGIDLPCFASFTQLKDEEGRDRLKKYFKKFAQVFFKGLIQSLKFSLWVLERYF